MEIFTELLPAIKAGFMVVAPTSRGYLMRQSTHPHMIRYAEVRLK